MNKFISALLLALFLILVTLWLYYSSSAYIQSSHFSKNYIKEWVDSWDISYLKSSVRGRNNIVPAFKSNFKYRKYTAADVAAVEGIKPLFYELESDTYSQEFIADIKNQSNELSSQEKLILFYASFYRTTWSHLSEWGTDGTFYFAESKTFTCPLKCAFTDDKKFSGSAHAILFPFIDAMMDIRTNKTKFMSPLRDRPQNQLWIISTLEPPSYNDGERILELGTMFNLTTTYRLDADIYWPYGFFRKLGTRRKPEEIKLPSKQLLGKKKLAASLISNCNSMSGRELMIKSMKKYISVDSYGGCGTKRCPSGDCRDRLGESYKFILAFENSLCQDYITEKFYEAFRVGAVPVALGLGDYSQVAPPNSYINAFDFPNVRALTDYMTFLDKSDEEYLKYFEWKRDYAVVSKLPVHVQFCRICMEVWASSRSGEEKQLGSFSEFYKHKMELRDSPYRRNDTLSYWLLQNATSACIPVGDVLNNNYFT